jgi:MtN3 and saliva related transmembrane protein
MSTTTTLAVSASAWGVAMALSPLLQVRAIRLHGSSHGVSIGYQSVLLVGFALWLAYAIAIDNVALMVPNTIALVVSATTIAVVRRYR